MGRTARETEAGSDKCPLGWWHGRGGEGGEWGQGSGRRRRLSSVSLWAQLPPPPGEDHGEREPPWGRGAAENL